MTQFSCAPPPASSASSARTVARGPRGPFPVPRGTLGHLRARRRRPGACWRGYSGPVPSHRRAHLPSRRLPPLSASGVRSLRPPRGRIRQTPAAPAFAEIRQMSAGSVYSHVGGTGYCSTRPSLPDWICSWRLPRRRGSSHVSGHTVSSSEPLGGSASGADARASLPNR